MGSKKHNKKERSLGEEAGAGVWKKHLTSLCRDNYNYTTEGLQPLQTTPLTSVGKYETRHGLVTHSTKYIPGWLPALPGPGRLMDYEGLFQKRKEEWGVQGPGLDLAGFFLLHTPRGLGG
jgi:hypothetical protein